MRIAIIAPGSRGDVEPYLALGKGLAAAGHVVRLVTHANFAGLAAAHGVEFWPIVGDVQEVAQGQEMSALLERGNFVAILARMAKEAERSAVEFAEGGLAACQGMDAVLAGIGGLFVGYALAEKLDLAFLQAHYIPFTPTRAYPSFLLPGLPSWLGGTFNRASYHLARQMMWQPFRAADRVVRQKVLGLPPSPLAGPFRSERFRRHPVLYGFSPAVLPPPDDWDASIHVTGYWFLDPPADWAPSPALLAFLQAGPPPVYIGFGSMSSRNPTETAALIVGALRQTGQRAVVLAGWGGVQMADLPDSENVNLLAVSLATSDCCGNILASRRNNHDPSQADCREQV
ncbi:MAG: glycosyltransferase [Candidatus Competibacteraceae bacterium]